MKYKIIVKTTYKNRNRVDACLSTWLSGEDYICLTDRLTGKGNEISGSKREDYYSAEEKTVFLINHVKDNDIFDDYDWLCFIDDDAIFNTKMWNYVMPYLDKTVIYGLKMSGYEKSRTTVYPSGGSGYFISPSLIKQHNYMIDNKWGIEDASVGKWMEKENIKLETHFKIEDRNIHLKLNGWFPFNHERSLLKPEHESHSPLFAKKILENIEDKNKNKKELGTYMTHHYIRWPELMNYIYEAFQEWTPEYL